MESKKQSTFNKWDRNLKREFSKEEISIDKDYITKILVIASK